MVLDVRPARLYEGLDFFEGLCLPLRIIHIERGPSFPEHRHDFAELVLVYGGSGVHRAGGESRSLGPGDVLVIPRGAEHAYPDAGSLSYVNVIFDAESLLGESLAEGSPFPPIERGAAASAFRLSALGLREALALANRIDQELFRKEECYGLAAKALFLQLWATLARLGTPRGAEGESSPARARRIAARMRANPALRASVEELAEEAGMSARNFRREFRRAVGEAPLAFLRRARVEEARALLEEGDKTVTQIAFLVGFEDSAYFARAFKDITGLSPSACRERARSRRIP